MSLSDKKNKNDKLPKLTSRSMNPKAAQSFLKKKKRELSVQNFVKGILKGDRMILSQAITLVESTRPSDQVKAQKIIEACLPHTGNSIRIGITGIPGVGKSTFIESLGKHVIDQKGKVAVLAIDPSSSVTKGSILGDKTRMTDLSSDKNAFIRPSPAGNSLGGVARKTRETILLCEAAGFKNIFVETVGVGQSEIAVHSMVDFFLLLLVPGAGDELQGIKRGIVEMADGVVVNKAEGELLALAKNTKRAYRNSMHLFPGKASGFTTKINLCSSLKNEGIEAVWENLEAYHTFTKENGYFEKKRVGQAKYWLLETIKSGLENAFFKNENIKKTLAEVEADVLKGQRSPFEAAEFLLKVFQSK